MAILSEIRKRPVLLMGIIALALLAFVVNPDSIDKVFGKNPDVLGKVNGEKITREEFNDQLMLLQDQAKQQGMPTSGLEEQAWQVLIQSKLVKQQFDKLGMELTDDMFWNQIQYDPMVSQNQNLFDEKGNFKVQELKKEIESYKANPEAYNNWLRARKMIETRIMARQLVANFSAGITASKKDAEAMMKLRDQLADIDYVKVDYAEFLKKNPIKVSTQDLADYIKKHQTIFKSQPSRNIGVVFFPANPSPADEGKVKEEIEHLLNKGSESDPNENFRNTANDSMFIALNSDAQFNPAYVPVEQLPQALQSQIATASTGQIFGPYKEQGYYVVSKLLDKKQQQNASTLARHILISYKDNPAGIEANMTEEKAKKLADSISAVVKTEPSKFDEFLNLSADKGSAAQGGSLGWADSSQPQFVPEFQDFVDKSPKGETGVVKTVYGYHIINIQDKKVENEPKMTYKVANLVRAIKPSEATENEIDKNSKRFIQQVQGRSFNEFSNIAKKAKYQFSNPKAVKRFDGFIQGLGTDKDSEILAWAFNKKREKGDVELFNVDGTGDKIVVYLNGFYDEELAEPESVREQIEPVVLNELAAKKIIEKLNKSKVSSLDQVAKLFGTTKQSGQINALTPSLAGSMEPRVAGASLGVAKGKLSNPIEGKTGVYLVVKKSESTNKQPGSEKETAAMLMQQNAQMFGQFVIRSLQNGADIKDYRIEVWDKVRQQ